MVAWVFPAVQVLAAPTLPWTAELEPRPGAVVAVLGAGVAVFFGPHPAQREHSQHRGEDRHRTGTSKHEQLQTGRDRPTVDTALPGDDVSQVSPARQRLGSFAALDRSVVNPRRRLTRSHLRA